MTPERFWRTCAFQPFELIRGQVVPLNPLGFRYGVIALRLGMALEDQTEALGRGEVVRSSCAFRLGVDTVRIPTVAYLDAQQLARHPYPYDFVPFAPLIAAEVFKEADSAPTVRQLIRDYLLAGTRTFWAVYPEESRLGVYERGQVRYLSASDHLTHPALPSFSLALSQLLPRKRED